MLKPVRAARGDRGTQKKSPEHISSAIESFVRGLGLTKTLRQYDVVTSWGPLVGEKIARVTQAQRMENGILFVGVSTAPWRAELAMRRLEIVEKINNAMGKKIVKEIRFR